MTIITCEDLNRGLDYHGRRQTRDTWIVNDILNLPECKNGLAITTKTAEYLTSCGYSGTPPVTIYDELSPESVNETGCAFIELGTPEFLQTLTGTADKIVLYQWQTTYLHTESFPDIGNDPEWILSDETDIPGHSHETVKRFRYERRKIS